ncbi:MAG: peptide deformylase [Phycisphaerae bacterium]|nr:peptide deformylase [Phycisphaerae bacterium]
MSAISEIDLSALKVVKYPDPRLREVCTAVEEFDDSLRGFVERMFEIMYASNGVGLAAPQVGQTIRLFIANPTAEPGGEYEGVYINPEIIERSGSDVGDEGCLSFPGMSCKIKRAEAVTIRAANLNGETFTQTAEGLQARIFQHESDHLDGILLSDRMSTVAKITNRRLLKDLEEDYAETKR